MPRHAWTELPAGVRTAIERECGPVESVEVPSAGRNSDFSATLHLSGTRVFCKGIADASGPRGRAHRHEAAINRWLPPIAPRLLWQAESDGWLLLGFEHVTGRHANLAPGSSDLPLITTTLNTMAERLCTGPADIPLLADKLARLAGWRRLRVDALDSVDDRTRACLDEFVEWEARAIDAVGGEDVVHTDLHPLNILVSAQVRVIDWAWSRRGAAWTDAAYLVIRLIAHGHDPATAEDWAATTVTWSIPSPADLTAFAVAILGAWTYLERTDPQPHRAHLTAAARQWAEYRLGR